MQPILGGGVSRGVCGLVPGHRAQEHVAFERKEPYLRRRGDGGRSRNVPEQGDLADVIPGPSVATWFPLVVTSAWPSAITYTRSPTSPSRITTVPADTTTGTLLRASRSSADGERFEERRRAEEREVLGRDPRADVDGSKSPAERQAHDGDDRAGDHEGPRGTERRHQGRTGERAEALAPHVHGLEHAEGTGELLVRDQALQHRPARDVVQDRAGAGDAEQDRGERGKAPIADTGTPYRNDPARKAGNSRSRLPATTAIAAPITPPIPSAALRAPTPVSPIPRTSSARTTIRTSMKPSTKVHSPSVPTRTRGRGSDHVAEARTELTEHRGPLMLRLGRWSRRSDAHDQDRTDPEEDGERGVHESGPEIPNDPPSAKKIVASNGPRSALMLSISPAAV